ncbi:MAG: UbiA prenyltransferase family protein [Muribaculaceae bacterium]|nr:UbiA prenyltransferase family protein [Muribaculaceae bacterium]
MLPPVIKLLRVKQWLKNAFVFLPLFFDKKLTDTHVLALTLVCAIAFSLAASAVYCLNDILDREADALHPVKRMRPIASGAVSVGTAWCIAAVCALLAIGLTAWLLPIHLLWLLIGYMALNVLYSCWLKHVGLVDVLIVASFYVMRVVGGAMAGDIMASQWIVVMTFLLALFLVLGKRRDDVILQVESGKVVRRGAANYNLEFINMALTMVATITIVAYMIYTMSDDVARRFNSHYTYCTTVFVLAGILRYMQLTVVNERSGSPTQVLMRDHFIQCCLAAWIVTFLIIIYC